MYYLVSSNTRTVPFGESNQTWTCAKATCTWSLLHTDSNEIVGIIGKGQCKRNVRLRIPIGRFLFCTKQQILPRNIILILILLRIKTAIDFRAQALLYVSSSSERKNKFIKRCEPKAVVYWTIVCFTSVANSISYFEEIMSKNILLGRIFVNKKRTI